jgi:hypothetical protein
MIYCRLLERGIPDPLRAERATGITRDEIDKLLGLVIRGRNFFDRSFRDQHAVGLIFALDETIAIMAWLFGEH